MTKLKHIMPLIKWKFGCGTGTRRIKMMERLRKNSDYVKAKKALTEKTPLHYGAVKGRLKTVKTLITDGTDVNAKDKYGHTPLHYSAKEGHLDIVKALIEAGANLNVKREDGSTPLHFSTEENHVSIVKILMDAGADVNVKNIYESSPLHHSAKKNFVDVAKLLIAAGADVNARDKGGGTPLHYSAEEGFFHVVKVLIAAGADVNAKKGKRTALHYSVKRRFEDIVEALVSAGADINAKDEDGFTPLHYSTFWRDLELTKTLIVAGADVNAKGDDGTTALHNSVCANVMKALVAAGADVYVRDERDRSPFDVRFKDKDTVKSLMKYTVLYTHTFTKPKYKYHVEMLDEFWNECNEQVKELKKTFLGDSSVSYFNFLSETDENKLALNASEVNFGKNNADLRVLFPTYFEDIKTQFVKGSERVYLLNKSQELMKRYIFKKLPIEVIMKISEQLKNEELKSLILAFK